jgi:hypothetical protein
MVSPTFAADFAEALAVAAPVAVLEPVDFAEVETVLLLGSEQPAPVAMSSPPVNTAMASRRCLLV